MKKKWWIIAVASVVVLGWIIAGSFSQKQTAEEKELTDMLSLPNNAHILQTTDADIDNNGKSEKVVLFGKKKNGDGVIAEEINVATIEPDTGFIKKTNLTSLNGFEPVMYVCDFTGDKQSDVLVTVLTGADKGLTKNVIVDFSGSIPKNIFPDENNEGLKLNLKLVDNFSIDANFPGGENFAINIAKDKEQLIKDSIYSQEGKLLDTKQQLQFLPFSLVQPVDTDGNGVFELVCHQKIVLGADQRELCNVISTHAFVDQKWTVKKIEYAHTVKNLEQ